ncbi:MAG: DUF3455 domain-containing protein [Ferruginibacter sp.]|nr:DUF3455 domain-containing protein [Bacteroidota bacterium]MBX2918627.1 DUF3455 domain-containing protein [Ferruginibacter sp.]
MYKQLLRNQPFYFLRFLLSLALITALIASCKKDDADDKDLPAYHISKSETLTIPVEVELPDNPPSGNARVATYYAKGVQKYKAQLKAGGGYEWVLVAPHADLFNSNNQKVGFHGAGPVWTITSADSIFAQHFAPARTATPDANSIPWLLLMPKTGKTPTGIFADVDYIQRIATTGGKAPVTPPQTATDTKDVFYTAIYRFSKRII